MSILSHRDEFLDLYKYAKSVKFEPTEPTKETDIIGFTYINKPNELEKDEVKETDNETIN